MSWDLEELFFFKYALHEMPFEVIPEKTIDKGLKILSKMIEDKLKNSEAEAEFYNKKIKEIKHGEDFIKKLEKYIENGKQDS